MENFLRKAHKIESGLNNNPAETFMSIVAKLNCGKRIDLSKRGAFQTRVYLACLRYNEG